MFKCPSCGSSEIMSIRVEVDATIDSGGTLECLGINMEYSDASRMDCGMCGHHGVSRTFTYPDLPGEHQKFGMSVQAWNEFLGRMGLEKDQKGS